MDDIYGRMPDDLLPATNSKDVQEESLIKKFYAGKRMLMTGSTGFMGKCLMEKLLRTCTDIEKIYTIVRPKKGQSIEERMKKYFENVYFDVVRKENPKFMEKVVPICGDLGKDDLALSPEDRQHLIENVDLVIHNGASVYFDAKISLSLKTNVLGTVKMLELANECPNMKAFLYISTGYSHCYNQRIEEKFYPPPADMKMIEDIIRADTENEAGLTGEALKGLLGQWTNTYTFTKSTAEGLVEQYSKRLPFPCGVFRPTIVTSTLKEPLKNWCGNVNGPVLPYIGVAMGVIHTAPVVHDSVFDSVPADLTTNAALVSLWDLAVHKKPKEPAMYHYSSSSLNPIRVLDFKSYMDKNGGVRNPSIRAAWPYFVILPYNLFTFYILHIIFHFFPFAFYDLSLLLRGKKPFVLNLFFKFNQNLRALYAFANGNWKIESKVLPAIWETLNTADQRLFYFDIKQVNWEEYHYGYWTGIRVYLLGESLDNLPAAEKKYNRLKILHRTIVQFLRLFALYCIYKLVGYIFNFSF